jgi:hypothetical protein
MKPHTVITKLAILVVVAFSHVTVTLVGADDNNAKGDEEKGEKEYVILGRKLVLNDEPLEDLPTVTWGVKTELRRILFPLKTDELWNGFYGYIDCVEEEVVVKKEDGELKSRILKGPIKIEIEDTKEVYDAPFSAEVFENAIGEAKDEPLVIVLDLGKFYLGREFEEKPISKAVDEGIDAVSFTAVYEAEGEYAALVPVQTKAGWKSDGEKSGEELEIEFTIESDISEMPEEVEYVIFGSFISVDGSYYSLLDPEFNDAIRDAREKRDDALSVYREAEKDAKEKFEAAKSEYMSTAEPIDETLDKPEVKESDFDKAVEVYANEIHATKLIKDKAVEEYNSALDEARKSAKDRGYTLKYSLVETEEKTTVFRYTYTGKPKQIDTKKDLSKTEAVGNELTACLKIVPGDPIFAPGYIISRTKLFEGNIASIVNTEFNATVYFDTNLTDGYLKNVLKNKAIVKIIKGEDDGEDKNDESEDKDGVSVADKGLVKDEKREAQAFVVIDRQLREGDKIKITLREEGKDIPIITDTVKEVKGTPFKDERIFSAQIMAENSEGITNPRAKIDYKDYWRPFSRGRLRWHLAGDISNGDASSEDYLKGRCEFYGRLTSGTSEGFASELYVGAAGSGSYFPEGETNFHEFGGTAAGELSLRWGNLEEQENVLRLRASPAFAFGLTRQKTPQGDRYNNDRFFRGSFPGDISYNFSGFGFKGEAILSIIRSDERTELGLPIKWPFYFGFTVTLDPKIVEGLPFGLDAQSPVALNLTFEEGRKPPKFEEIDSRLSVGFEYSPVIK